MTWRFEVLGGCEPGADHSDLPMLCECFRNCRVMSFMENQASDLTRTGISVVQKLALSLIKR